MESLEQASKTTTNKERTPEEIFEEIDQIISQHTTEEAQYQEHAEAARQNPEDWPSMYTYVNGQWMENYRSGYTPGNGLLGQAIGRVKHSALSVVKNGVEKYHERKLDKLRTPQEVRAEGQEQVAALLDEQEREFVAQKFEELLGALENSSGDETEQAKIAVQIENLRIYTGLEL